MSSKFLTSSKIVTNLDSGTATIYGATIGATNLVGNSLVTTDASGILETNENPTISNVTVDEINFGDSTYNISRSGTILNIFSGDVDPSMSFINTGDVGINTNAPLFPLDVNGEIHSRTKISVDTSTTMPMELTFGASSEHEIYMGTPGAETGIIFNINNLGNRSRFDMFNFDDVTVNDRYFGLKYRDATGGLYIKRNDRVGINKTNPSTTLDVNGDATIGTNLTLTNGNIDLLNGTIDFNSTPVLYSDTLYLQGVGSGFIGFNDVDLMTLSTTQVTFNKPFNTGANGIGGHAVGNCSYIDGSFSATTQLPGFFMYPVSGNLIYLMYKLGTASVGTTSLSIDRYNSSDVIQQSDIITLNIANGATYVATSLAGLSTFSVGDYYIVNLTAGNITNGITIQLYSVFL